MTHINYVVCKHEWDERVVFNHNFFPKMKDCSRLAPLKAVVYTVKVAVTRNGAWWTRCYYTQLIRSVTWPLDSYHFQWPCVTLKRPFACCMTYEMHAIRRTFVRNLARFQLTWHVTRSLGEGGSRFSAGRLSARRLSAMRLSALKTIDTVECKIVKIISTIMSWSKEV